MAQKHRKKPARIRHLSSTPLPAKLQAQYTGLLVFSDASRKYCGGLAAVLFATPEAAPHTASLSVPLYGSNELELTALLFGLRQADLHFPGTPLTLFSDNSDAVERINRAKTQGIDQDPLLEAQYGGPDLATLLERSTIRWIKGHAACRGNALADELAGLAALGGLAAQNGKAD